MKYLLFPLLLAFSACTNQNLKNRKQILDFGYFIIETPNSWEKIKEKGVDSYVGRIAIDAKDTVAFDLGLYSNTLTEDYRITIDRDFLNSHPTIDTTDLIVVEKGTKVDMDAYRKNNVSWDTIDGRAAKIVYPRKSGVGTTGIYIDSLWGTGSSIDKFNLAGYNLKASNEKLFLTVLKTLKFKQPTSSN